MCKYGNVARLFKFMYGDENQILIYITEKLDKLR